MLSDAGLQLALQSTLSVSHFELTRTIHVIFFNNGENQISMETNIVANGRVLFQCSTAFIRARFST